MSVHYGPKTEDYYKKAQELIWWPTGDTNRPVFSGGKGIREIDLDGNEFLNFSSHVGIMPVGQAPWQITSAVAEQERLYPVAITQDWMWQTRHKVGYLKGEDVSPLRLAEILQATPVKAPKKVFMEVSGATSVNAALMWGLATFLKDLARDEKRKKFAAFRRAFHGRHGPSKDVSSSKLIHKLLHESGFEVVLLDFPRRGHVIHRDYMDRVRSVLNANDGEIAALIMEPIQGEGGINIADTKAVSLIYQETQIRGIRFILDEIQTGIGRTGKMYAGERFEFNADAIALSKALGSGHPIGAVVARSDLLPDGFPKGAHSGTYPWSPTSVAAAIAVFKMIKELRLVENAALNGEYLQERLKGLFWGNDLGREAVEEIDGLGLMIGVRCRTAEWAHKIVQAAYQQRPGLALIEAGESTIRFMPPLIITKGEIDEAMDILKTALKSLNF